MYIFILKLTQTTMNKLLHISKVQQKRNSNYASNVHFLLYAIDVGSFPFFKREIWSLNLSFYLSLLLYWQIGGVKSPAPVPSFAISCLFLHPIPDIIYSLPREDPLFGCYPWACRLSSKKRRTAASTVKRPGPISSTVHNAGMACKLGQPVLQSDLAASLSVWVYLSSFLTRD